MAKQNSVDPNSNEFGNDATGTTKGSSADEELLRKIKEELG